jgi:arginine decarboxylase
MTSKLLGQLRAYQDKPPLLFCTGHHQGRWVSPELRDMLGQPALAADLTELAGLDNLQAPTAQIAQAQNHAAQVWGAQATFFLVNGSTVGLQALLLGTLRPGEEVLLPRNVHRAVIGALLLGNIVPIWLEPIWEGGIAHGVTVQEVALKLASHPQAKAVLLLYPTYYGVCASLKDIVQLVHRHR